MMKDYESMWFELKSNIQHEAHEAVLAVSGAHMREGDQINYGKDKGRYEMSKRILDIANFIEDTHFDNPQKQTKLLLEDILPLLVLGLWGNNKIVICVTNAKDEIYEIHNPDDYREFKKEKILKDYNVLKIEAECDDIIVFAIYTNA